MNDLIEPIEFVTPVGRIVSGDCFVGRDKDQQGAQLTIKTGPNMGKPRTNFYIGLAIAKTDPGYAELRAKIQEAAVAGFPSGFDASGNPLNPAFAFKVTDGDSTIPNSKGIAPCTRTGYPGNWVLHFSGGQAPKCYESGGQTQIFEASRIKRGYFVRISGNVKVNGNAQNPGVYLNYRYVEFYAYGEEIQVGPSSEEVFSAAAPITALPAGASATPITPGAGTPPTAPVAPVAPVAPLPGQVSVPAPAMPVAAPIIPVASAPAPVTPVAAPVAPAPDFVKGPKPLRTTPDGQSFNEEQLAAAGHSPEQIAALPISDIPF